MLEAKTVTKRSPSGGEGEEGRVVRSYVFAGVASLEVVLTFDDALAISAAQDDSIALLSWVDILAERTIILSPLLQRCREWPCHNCCRDLWNLSGDQAE